MSEVMFKNIAMKEKDIQDSRVYSEFNAAMIRSCKPNLFDRLRLLFRPAIVFKDVKTRYLFKELRGRLYLLREWDEKYE